MHLAYRVNEHISKRRPATICDSCIAMAIEIRPQQANRMTIALETTSDFERGNGICVDCRKEQKVIRRV